MLAIWLSKFIKLVENLLQEFSPKEIEEIEYIPIKMENKQEKLLRLAIEALDTDLSPDDLVKDEVGCAESISNLIKKVLPDFPVILSTKDLDTKLFLDKRFLRVTEPERGCLVISPRTTTTYGHVGIFTTSERIASNNSKNGLFQATYSWQDWIKEFKDKRGLKIYLYKLLA